MNASVRDALKFIVVWGFLSGPVASAQMNREQLYEYYEDCNKNEGGASTWAPRRGASTPQACNEPDENFYVIELGIASVSLPAVQAIIDVDGRVIVKPFQPAITVIIEDPSAFTNGAGAAFVTPNGADNGLEVTYDENGTPDGERPINAVSFFVGAVDTSQSPKPFVTGSFTFNVNTGSVEQSIALTNAAPMWFGIRSFDGPIRSVSFTSSVGRIAVGGFGFGFGEPDFVGIRVQNTNCLLDVFNLFDGASNLLEIADSPVAPAWQFVMHALPTGAITTLRAPLPARTNALYRISGSVQGIQLP